MEKRLHKNTRNIPLRLAAVLLCLTLASTSFVSGLFARYVATDQGGDSARVAKFSITGSDVLTQPISASFAPGEEKRDIKIQIANDSEVTVDFTVSVSNETNNLPLELALAKDGTTVPGNKATEQLAPGKSTKNYTLTIDWPVNKNDPKLMGQLDYILVKVTAVQVD